MTFSFHLLIWWSIKHLQMESVLRHCYVMNPKEFSKANNEGDDVFLCEYEYDVHRHSFKRLADINNEEVGL